MKHFYLLDAKEPNSALPMKKLIELIRNKDREEKPLVNAKKTNPKEEKHQNSGPMDLSSQPPSDLFWDDYSDVGYC